MRLATRQARHLEDLLMARAVTKRFAVTWDQAPETGHQWRWCVDWVDGPPEELVRAWCAELAPDVEPLDIGELSFHRRISLIAWSVQLVRHVSAGGQLEERYAARYLVEETLRVTNGPDEPADAQEGLRAKALRRLVMRTASHAGDQVVTVGDEMEMLEALRRCGLAVLDLDAELDALGG